jgi:hypothetical protein
MEVTFVVHFLIFVSSNGNAAVSCEFISDGLVVVAMKPKANISWGPYATALHYTD